MSKENTSWRSQHSGRFQYGSSLDSERISHLLAKFGSKKVPVCHRPNYEPRDRIPPFPLMRGQNYRDGIFKESMGARNRGGIGLSYRPARLHRLAEFIPWNRFLGSINV